MSEYKAKFEKKEPQNNEIAQSNPGFCNSFSNNEQLKIEYDMLVQHVLS